MGRGMNGWVFSLWISLGVGRRGVGLGTVGEGGFREKRGGWMGMEWDGQGGRRG